MKLLTRMVLFLVLVAYVVIGGVVFHLLESDNEETTKQNVTALLQEFFESNECVSPEEFVEVLRKTSDVFRSGGFVIQRNGTEMEFEGSQSNWDYYSAIFFAMTVVSTIGYGNISPSTWQGMVFCAAFALVGIPLFLIVIGYIGSSMYGLMKKSQKCCFTQDHDGKVSKKQKICGNVFYAILGIGLFIAVPGVIFGIIEGWSYLEGIYYSFITLTTIGFGDYIAGQDGTYEGFRSIYRLCTTAWIIIGLAWMAGIISSLQEEFTSSIETRESMARSATGTRHNSRSDVRINTVDSRQKDRTGSQPDIMRMYSVESETTPRGKPPHDMSRCYSVESAITNGSQQQLVRSSTGDKQHVHNEKQNGHVVPEAKEVDNEDVYYTKL